MSGDAAEVVVSSGGVKCDGCWPGAIRLYGVGESAGFVVGFGYLDCRVRSRREVEN